MSGAEKVLHNHETELLVRPAAAVRVRQRDMISRRVLLTIWPFVAIIVTLVAFAAVQRDILSSIRAYVSGESLWSKAQKKATMHLAVFADTGSTTEFGNYRDAIDILLGDRRARIELEKDQPDLIAIREGFLAGQNAAEDIPGLIRLFRNFRHRLDYLDRAIDIWAMADELIAQLDTLAQRLYRLRMAAEPDLSEIASLKAQVLQIDRILTPMEEDFSNTLGEASRWIERVLGWAMLVVAISLMLPGIWLTRRLARAAAAAETALRDSERRHALALAGSQDGLWDWNLDSTALYCSPHMLEMLGVVPVRQESVELGILLRCVHLEDQRRVLECVRARALDGQHLDVEFRVQREGQCRWLRLRGQVVAQADGRAGEMAGRMVGSVSDITEREQARSELLVERERSHLTLQSIVEAVITTDRAGRINYLNPVALALLDRPESQIRGLLVAHLLSLHEEQGDHELPDVVQQVLDDGVARKYPCWLQVNDRPHERFPVHLSAAPLLCQGSTLPGGPGGVVLVLRDARQEHDDQRRLSWRASHDALTGLCNRHEFEQRLEALIQRCRIEPLVAVAMYIDLDHFKAVNDGGGHPAGDELLRQLALILQQQLRRTDLVARLGGDEFGVLLQDCSLERGLRIADKLCEAVAAHRFVWKERVYRVAASIGVVQVDHHTQSVDEVLAASDAACYQAKERGRGQALSLDVVHELAPVDMPWVKRLQAALAEQRLCLHAQEIACLNPAPGKVRVEVLLRLLDEQGELVLPMAFIPAAERHGLMPELDLWVMREVMRLLHAGVRTSDGRAIDIAFLNVSWRSLADSSFIAAARELFAANPHLQGRICLEIGQTLVGAHATEVMHFMSELQAVGVRFALDAFGVGSASYMDLRVLPVDFIKIAGRLIRDMEQDPVSHAMVVAIHAVVHAMGKQTIAQCVEQPVLLTSLRQIGIDAAQGYALGLPRPLDMQIEASLHDQAST